MSVKRTKVRVGDPVTIHLADGGRIDTVLGPDIDLDTEDIRDDRGRRVTGDDVDDMVADVVANGPGRPNLQGRRGVSPTVQFRLPPQLLDAAEAASARTGKTISALARQALEEYLRTAA